MCLLVVGCANGQESRLNQDPRSYDEAMDLIRDEVRGIDKSLIGGNYRDGVLQCQRLLHYSGYVTRQTPSRIGNTIDAYTEYDKQVEDLKRTADWLLFLMEQRRRQAAMDSLAEYVRRYNRLSMTYGPTVELNLSERDDTRYVGPEASSENLPNDIRQR